MRRGLKDTEFLRDSVGSDGVPESLDGKRTDLWAGNYKEVEKASQCGYLH